MAARRNIAYTRKIKLEDEGKQNDWAYMTPGERIDFVWELTRTAWLCHDPNFHESRLRSEFVRIIRRWEQKS
jgi:hypothetical protein